MAKLEQQGSIRRSLLCSALQSKAGNHRARPCTVAILAAFAVGYGCVALATPTAITLAGTPVSYLRDPLLLSLSLLTTVGVFDLALHGAVRSVAYLEMLFVASAAGGAAIVAVRAFSQRAQELLYALNIERQGG